ncbi:hypothetical protein [Marinoscillum sp.]|uniref:hypothetical protein n=1 Tax=Marinoscillum sp. TaxID=2024838 RepID=UPI003BABE450
MNKKILRYVLFILLLIVVIGSYWYLNFVASERLSGLLGDRVKIDGVEVNLLGRQVRFKAPKVYLDSIEGQADLSLDARAGAVTIENFSFLDLVLNKEIGVGDLRVDSAELELVLPTDKLNLQGKKEINLFVRELFTSINLHRFLFRSTNIRILKGQKRDTLLVVKNFQIDARDIVIDTSTVSHVFPLEFGWSKISADSFDLKAGDFYILSGTDFLIEDTTVTIHQVKLTPSLSREAFVAQLPHEKALFHLDVEQITAKDLVWSLENGFEVSSSKVEVDEAQLRVYKDKRPPPQPLVVKPLLSEVIRQIPMGITLDTITVTNSYIEYEQYPVLFPRSGKIFFDQTYASIYNLSSDSSRVVNNPMLVTDVQCDFMGEGKLTTQIRMNLLSPTSEFTVYGRLEELPVTYVNQVMTPLVGVTAEGTVHHLDFDFEGDDYASSGKLTSEYSDLKISIYEDDRDKDWLKTLFGNLVLRNNNHEDSLGYKEGEIYFIRYQNKDFFNYLWNSIRVGIMDIAVPFHKNPDSTRSSNKPKFKYED